MLHYLIWAVSMTKVIDSELLQSLCCFENEEMVEERNFPRIMKRDGCTRPQSVPLLDGSGASILEIISRPDQQVSLIPVWISSLPQMDGDLIPSAPQFPADGHCVSLLVVLRAVIL